MTNYDRQMAAIDMAVRAAMAKMDLATLRSQPFFGTNERMKDADQMAA
ncbi:hypothetical protein [Pseudooceanicola algae]|uniref:Uncharacterized protein n=1 Tax=Pseudooceanicola algae TaxID=1537215 RepID=A0A418SDG2_9RHOB|nr:hypothetical protein [Pseudooceanicola algae]QPM89397.1 hypothetical protein PSAL_006130 [Pseudooceanicola algae]